MAVATPSSALKTAIFVSIPDMSPVLLAFLELAPCLAAWLPYGATIPVIILIGVEAQ
jgi:hypothetical protein